MLYKKCITASHFLNAFQYVFHNIANKFGLFIHQHMVVNHPNGMGVYGYVWGREKNSFEPRISS